MMDTISRLDAKTASIEWCLNVAPQICSCPSCGMVAIYSEHVLFAEDKVLVCCDDCGYQRIAREHLMVRLP